MSQQKETPSYLIPPLPSPVSQQEQAPEILPLAIEHQPWPEYGGLPQTEVGLWQSATGLHLRFRVWEATPRIACLHHNEPVYEDSCVEFFLQPCPGSDPRYVNFEMNAAGVLLLKLGGGRNDRQFLAPAEFSRFAIEVSGPLRRRNLLLSSEEPCWETSFSIPFDWLGSLFPDFRAAPGWEMRGNFYKCGDRTPSPHYGCWSPMTSAQPDFHRSCDFGLLVL